MSGIPGAGRTVGALLASAGRRLEPVLSRAAERLGFGPAPLARRLYVLILEQHHRQSWCLGYPEDGMFSSRTIRDMSCYPCRQCNTPVNLAIGAVFYRASRDILDKLLQYLN